ncbi:MAG: AAA family ATPase [Clostridia bacterium]|nr:AAA family ATPase [Clostridia bacterium]
MKMNRDAAPKCGLLGEKLGHSYSPQIHAALADYEYRLYEKEGSEIGTFLSGNDWDGLNVTIPYKKAVIPYLSELSPTALETGSVNTIVRKEGGKLFGDNTDVYGFIKMTEHAGITVEGRKALVLGSGGASAAAVTALRKMNAKPLVISRSGKDNYDNLSMHRDAEIIVNTTPLGMYPKNGGFAVNLEDFPNLCGVLDVIYNPARTALLLKAEKLGIPYANGLYMLVAQAKRSCELFLDENIPDTEIDRVYRELSLSCRNIILIGMPGTGKSTVARKISEITNRRMYDSDEEITRKTGQTPEQLIGQRGESTFRDIETEILGEVAKQSEAVIATGGGVVVRERNYDILHQNGTVVWLQRDLTLLEDKNRPILQKEGAEELYRQREPLYRKFADITLRIGEDEAESAKAVIEALAGGSQR